MSSENIGIEEARKRLGDLITAAQQGADIVITRNGKPAARIVRYEGTAMTTTTSYGSWTRADSSSTTLADSVTTALGEFANDYDTDAICDDYRAAINAALPNGITLNGDEFYGPYPMRDDVDLREIVASVDFWAIVERHDTSSEPAAEQSTHTYSLSDGLADLALPWDLEERLTDATSYGDDYDPDRAMAIRTEIEDAINAKLAEHGITEDGIWLGDWSAANIVRAALDRHGA